MPSPAHVPLQKWRPSPALFTLFLLPTQPLPPPTWLCLKNLFPTIPPTHQKTHSIYDPIRNRHLCLCNKPQITVISRPLPPQQLPAAIPRPPPAAQPLFLPDSESLLRQIHPHRMPLGRGAQPEAKRPDVITWSRFHHQSWRLTAMGQASSNSVEQLLFPFKTPPTPVTTSCTSSLSPAPWHQVLPPIHLWLSGSQWTTASNEPLPSSRAWGGSLMLLSKPSCLPFRVVRNPPTAPPAPTLCSNHSGLLGAPAIDIIHILLISLWLQILFLAREPNSCALSSQSQTWDDPQPGLGRYLQEYTKPW